MPRKIQSNESRSSSTLLFTKSKPVKVQGSQSRVYSAALFTPNKILIEDTSS